MSETKTYVKWIRENSRVTLVLDRPEALNAVNTEVLMQLEECLDRIKQDPSIRFVVLTGAGERSFCAGGDICEQNENGVLQAVGFAENGHRVTRKLETLPCVTLAVVNGYALGGGCDLADRDAQRFLCITRNTSWHHPRLGRHTASAQTDREGFCQRDDLYRRTDQGG